MNSGCLESLGLSGLGVGTAIPYLYIEFTGNVSCV